MMNVIIVKKVFIWDGVAKKFRVTKFRLDEITATTVTINGIVYHRKGEKRVGRVIETRISANSELMIGRVIPIFA